MQEAARENATVDAVRTRDDAPRRLDPKPASHIEAKPAPSPARRASVARELKTVVTGRSIARDCGDCRACCKLPDIPELSKPLNTWCQNATLEGGKPGCSVYSDRPSVCRDFACAWLLGLGGAEDRPDKLGVMLHRVTMPDGDEGLGVVEYEDGALDRPRVRQLIDGFLRAKPGRIVERRASERSFRLAQLTISAPNRKPASQVEHKPLPRQIAAKRQSQSLVAATLAARAGR